MKTCGQDNVPYLDLFIFVLHVVIDCLLLAELLANPAIPRVEVNALVSINHGDTRYGIAERNTNSGVRAKEGLTMHYLSPVYVFEGDSAGGADLGAGATATAHLAELGKRSGHLPLEPALVEVDGT